MCENKPHEKTNCHEDRYFNRHSRKLANGELSMKGKTQTLVDLAAKINRLQADELDT